jgi:hypothetical protein
MAIQALNTFNTLVEAKAYQTTQNKTISANLMNSLLAQNGLTRAMKIIAETDGHIAQNAMISFFDPRSTEYNFIQGDATGDAQIALLDSLIAAGSALDTVVGGSTVNVATLFSTLRPILLGLCNENYNPYANTTEHQFQVAKKTITYSPVTAVKRLVKLDVATAVEKHNPRICERIQDAGAGIDYYKPVGFLSNVGGVGSYIAQVSSAQTTLYLEDAYNLVS